MKKQFKDLNLSNSFLFAAALNDPETCRMVLKIMLGHEVSKVNVKTEHSIMLSSDARCVRLDVNARDEYNVNYDIEAQNEDDKNIVKRSRYYQAEMDVAELKPGDDFNKLPNSYVIFICTFDPFGKGLYRYTFTQRCEENGMPLGDGTYKIFLNTRGNVVSKVPDVLINFLGYFENSTDDYVISTRDESITELHRKITELKKSREWEAGYMKLEELFEKKKREGIEQGQHIALVASISDFLSDKGDLSAELKERIEAENDITKLNEWIKLAVKTETIEEFEKNM